MRASRWGGGIVGGKLGIGTGWRWHRPWSRFGGSRELCLCVFSCFLFPFRGWEFGVLSLIEIAKRNLLNTGWGSNNPKWCIPIEGSRPPCTQDHWSLLCTVLALKCLYTLRQKLSGPKSRGPYLTQKCKNKKIVLHHASNLSHPCNKFVCYPQIPR